MDEREYIVTQMGTVTHASFLNGALHRMPVRGAVTIEILDGTVKSPQQAAWWLENDRWEADVRSSCGRDGCCTHLVLGPGSAPDEGTESTAEEQLLGLVQRQSVTLADLYRKGRKKGLLAPQQDYHQG